MSFGEHESGSGGFGSRESSFKPKPVEVGKEYDVTISEVSRRGDGIAKIDGFVIFVAGGKQGQSAKIKVTQVSNRYAMGTVVEGSGTTAASGATEASDAIDTAAEMAAADE
jgi:predicted RNA-binding protein with TRAM domain